MTHLAVDDFRDVVCAVAWEVGDHFSAFNDSISLRDVVCSLSTYNVWLVIISPLERANQTNFKISVILSVR